MLFFRKKPIVTDTREPMARSWVSFEAAEQVAAMACGTGWNPGLSISRVVGMALGGMRSAGFYTNDKLNEQANALSNLSQKTVPLVLHVKDLYTGNNQTLRLPYFRFFAGDSQQSVDFAVIAHRLAELTLLPIMVVHAASQGPCEIPSAELVQSFLGDCDEHIAVPTPSQRLLFGPTRRRMPRFWDLDAPMTTGLTHPATLRDRQWAAKQAFFNAHVHGLLKEILQDWAERTGRVHEPARIADRNAKHVVVVSESAPEDMLPGTPLVKINYITPELHTWLTQRTLSFVERNHSRALSTALQLQGYSLVHYGRLDARALQTALALSAENPVDIAGVHHLYTGVLTPKEEIYNQQLLDMYPNLGTHNTPTEVIPPRPIQAPSSLQHHPINEVPLADLHRFWAHNGKYLASGQPWRAVATPALAMGVLPAGSGKMLGARTSLVARRVVEPQTLLAALVRCMQSENFETAMLENMVRPLHKKMTKWLVAHPDLQQKALPQLQVLVEAEATAMGLAASAFLHQWSNALHFLSPHCEVIAPFAALGGILVEDRSDEHRAFFDLLPNTDARFMVEPDHIFLDKDAYASYVRTENTAVQTLSHMVSAVASIEARKRSAQLQAKAQKLLQELEQHNRKKLSVNLSGDLDMVLRQMSTTDLTLAELAQKLDREQAPVDRMWLMHVHGLQSGLHKLQQVHAEGAVGRGRSSHGIVSQDAAGVYPWSPVVVPWTQNGNGEGLELALGIWEAQMQVLCADFVTMRKAALEVEGRYNPRLHDDYFARFDWRQLSAEELALCPPLVVTGTDLDFYEKGAGLNGLLRHGAPIKVLVFDTLQSHPTSLLQQLLAHDILALQASLADRKHLLDGLRDCLCAPKPSLMHVLCPPGSDYEAFSKRAWSSQFWPCFTGEQGEQGPVVQLHTHTAATLRDGFPPQGGTIADMAIAHSVLSHWLAPMENTQGTDLSQWLTLDLDDRAELIPTVQSIMAPSVQGFYRVLPPLLQRAEEWRRFWKLLGQLCPAEHADIPQRDALEERNELLQNLTNSLVRLAQEGNV